MTREQKISIVTPSYNQAQFIEETINSVLDQNYPNLQYIIMDGGSTDGSVEIIKKYEKHLDYWISEPDSGQSHAINKGLAKCDGDIFNWINSDDYYEPDAFKLVNEAFQDEQISMACFRSNVFGLQNRISRGTDIFLRNLPKAIAYSRIDQPETFFRMNAVRKMGPLDTSLHYCMDKEWLLRYFLLFGNDNIYKSNVPVLNFRYHEDSKSVSRQHLFAKDSDMIYAGLAKHFEFDDHAEIIASLSSLNPATLSPRSLKKSALISNEILSSAFDYYLFKRFKEHYEELDLAKCMTISGLLRTKNLSMVDKKEIENLLFRSRALPRCLIQLIRKVSR